MPRPAVLSPEWTEALAAWALAAHRAGLVPATIRTRRACLVKLASAAATDRNPWEVTAASLAAWLDHPHAWAPTTPGVMRSGLHTFYTWALAAGHVSSNPAPDRGRVRVRVPAAWADALSAWEADERVAGRASATLAKREKHAILYATTDAPADPWEVTAADLGAWFRSQPWDRATATAARSTLRAFYSWAVSTGRTPHNPAIYLTALAACREPRPLGARGPLPSPVPEAWAGPLRLYARHLYAQGRAPATVALRDAHLRRVARDLAPLAPWSVTEDALLDWFAGQQLANGTRISIRQTVRGFYAWAVEMGHLDDDPARRLPKARPTLPNPRPASERAVRAALLTADARERLMLRLAAEVGLRRGEVSRVHTRDLFETAGGWSLLVHGKGARERVVPLPGALAAALHVLPSGWAFPSPAGPSGHLTPPTVGKLLTRLLPEGTTPHALRHRFATRAYDLDHDVFAVQRLLGHARPETTQRYVATTDDRLRLTVERLAALTAC